MSGQINTRFQVLSLDGGGSRGIFSAAVLAHLERDIGGPIVDHFDLIVGTSTGGLIAVALGLGFTPVEILNFYLSNCPRIFKRRPLSMMRSAIRPKYDGKVLTAAIRETLGQRLLGHSRKRLVVPAYDLGEMKVHLFKTAHDARFARDYRIEAWKVARATSAAPTFFSAFRDPDDHTMLIDGGVWANNPSLIGLAEAISVLKQPISNVRMFSLGTNEEIPAKERRKLQFGGWWQWKKDAVHVLMAGQSEGASNQAKLILGDRFLRFSPPATEGRFQLDCKDADGLIARAAHHSRKLVPDFRAGFAEHRAPDFKPYYTLEAKNDTCPPD